MSDTDKSKLEKAIKQIFDDTRIDYEGVYEPDATKKLLALITQQCNQARKDLLNDLKQVTFNAVMSDKDAHGATEDYIAAELAQAKETN